MHMINRCMLLVIAVMALVQTAFAQEVGTVAAIEGTAEIGRQEVWTAAVIGAAVHQGDVLRTGSPGRLRVVFQDDSVLSLTEDSRVVVDESVFNPSTGKVHSLLGLLQGQVSALVSEYYHRSGATYEIKTPTAVAGVRGTEFSVAYYPGQEVTEVVGMRGVVSVRSVVDLTGPGVLLRENEATTVLRGRLPTRPHRMDEAIFQQRLEGIQFIGQGRPESMTTGHAVRTGASVPAPDRAGAVASRGAPSAQKTRHGRDVGTLVGKSPVIVMRTTGQVGIPFPR